MRMDGVTRPTSAIGQRWRTLCQADVLSGEPRWAQVVQLGTCGWFSYFVVGSVILEQSNDASFNR